MSDKELITIPRVARKVSNSGIYHVMVRGINKQNIFLDMEDYLRCLRTLSETKKRCEYTIHGYCLMDNHIHLLLQEGAEAVGHTMRRIGTSYAKWHNTKYQRVGHLFQSRFLSEVVDDDSYFQTLLRYIHQNPVKAGMVSACIDYPWSSYKDYATPKQSIEPGLTDTKLGLQVLGGVTQLIEFCSLLDQRSLPLEDPLLSKIEIAQTIISSYLESHSIENLELIKLPERNYLIKKLKKESGLSCTEIAKLTGFSTSVIKKALAESSRL